MENEMTVLLVEDDPQTCAEITGYIDTLEDLSLAGVTNSAERALELIRNHLPDAMILDLELHRGSGNGLSLLQNLEQMALPAKPYILVTTNNSSATTYEYARHHGADFILAKHQADYTPRSAVDFLRMMKEAILGRTRSAAVRQETAESPERRNKRFVRRICAELDKVGISPKAIGYQYLVDGILIIIQGPTQNLCTIIGEKYGKTDSSVERAMQNAIARAWRRTPIDDLYNNYTAKISSEKGVPTITEFVYYYANKIRNE